MAVFSLSSCRESQDLKPSIKHRVTAVLS